MTTNETNEGKNMTSGANDFSETADSDDMVGAVKPSRCGRLVTVKGSATPWNRAGTQRRCKRNAQPDADRCGHHKRRAGRQA